MSQISITPQPAPHSQPEQNQSQIIHNETQLLVLNKFHKRLEREKYVNNYASNYYGSMQQRFTIPGIIITGICSIFSFLATNDIFNADTKNGFSISIGILTAAATVLQSVASAFGFSARKDAFQRATESYNDLITKLEFEIYNPNENFLEFCNDLEDTILKIKKDCTYLAPLFIIAKYEKDAAHTNISTAMTAASAPSVDGNHTAINGGTSVLNMLNESFNDILEKQLIKCRHMHNNANANGNANAPHHDQYQPSTKPPSMDNMLINPDVSILDLEYDEV